jgi:hypothetical protein
MRLLTVLLYGCALAAQTPDGAIASRKARKDFTLTADPASKAWKGVPPVIADGDAFGKPVPGHRTEIRSRWTDANLYLLFTCPYEQLNLKPQPSTSTETNRLWNWDVAEAFLGSDFENIGFYKEFQVSPQGEWVDLDIRRGKPLPEGGWKWNSGFEVKARIDEARKVWYGEMRIPMKAIDARPPLPGRTLRANFYRLQGPRSAMKMIAWRPTNKLSYHVPEAFGTLRLVK